MIWSNIHARINVLISGSKTRHCSYTQVASGESGGEDAPLNELQTLEEQVIHFFPQ